MILKNKWHWQAVFNFIVTSFYNNWPHVIAHPLGFLKERKNFPKGEDSVVKLIDR